MGRRRRRVKQVRLDAGPTGTQAEIWMAGAGGFTTLNLSDPARLVVDLPASSARVVDAGGDRPRQVGADRPSGTGNLAHRVRSGRAGHGAQAADGAGGRGSRLLIEWPGDGPATAAAGKAAVPVPAPDQPSVNLSEARRATAALGANAAMQAAQPLRPKPS
jgi:N-acetylmuramoyl-L-alanine amidase